LIATHNGVKGKYPRIDINKYPAVKDHLDQYWDKISTRADKGDTPYNLRNCAYWEDFSKPKIVYPDICTKPSFHIDCQGYLISNTTYMITTPNKEAIKHICKILNSDIMNWYYRTLSVQLGKEAVRMFSIYVLNIPIPPLSDKPIEEILKLTSSEQKFIRDNSK
jgi:hypothetical protein